MKTLAAFLTANGLSQAEFARLSGGSFSASGLKKWLNGDRRPSLGQAVAIEAMTRGEVPVTSWVPADQIPKAIPKRRA